MNDTQEPKVITNRMGWALSLMAVAILGIQILIQFTLAEFAPAILETDWYGWAVTAFSVVGIGLPLFYLASKAAVRKADKGEVKKLRITQFITIFFVCVAAMYIFNFIGIMLAFLLSFLKGSDILNPLEDAVMNGNPLLGILYGAIIGPIAEELIFRKVLLDRLRRLGDLAAILISGIAFGLFHMNILQFFYATALGFIFAYVTVKTNTILYAIILHMMINSIGVAIAPAIVKSENVGAMMVMGTWVLTAIAVGCTLFALNVKKLRFEKVEMTSVKKSSYFLNPGTIVFTLICLAMTVVNMIAL